MKVKAIIEYNEEEINKLLEKASLNNATVEEIKGFFKGVFAVAIDGEEVVESVEVEVSE